MLIKRAKAYSSSGSQVILVYLHLFRRNSLFCSQKWPKITKNQYFYGSRSFKVIDVDISKKLVASACYDKQHVCAYLQLFSCKTSQQRINNYFLEGYPSLISACATLLERRGFGLRLLKSAFSTENFIRRLFWSISRHFGAIHL